MELVELGRFLEERRKELGMPRTELARRVGVTKNYVWLVERARLRDGGQPSQPSKELLEQWVVVLRWDVEHRRRVMELAGHPDPVLDGGMTPIAFGNPLSFAHSLPYPDETQHSENAYINSHQFHGQLDELLELARGSNLRAEELRKVWGTFLPWLKVHLATIMEGGK